MPNPTSRRINTSINSLSNGEEQGYFDAGFLTQAFDARAKNLSRTPDSIQDHEEKQPPDTRAKLSMFP